MLKCDWQTKINHTNLVDCFLLHYFFVLISFLLFEYTQINIACCRIHKIDTPSFPANVYFSIRYLPSKTSKLNIINQKPVNSLWDKHFEKHFE